VTSVHLFSKPLIIWSGTWEFSTADIAAVTTGRRDKLSILASERNKEGYQRLTASVDGNAYYWSSVNPDTFPNYAGKLSEMGKAVHANRGLWIAPAAPGRRAGRVGGTRWWSADGATLRREFDAAPRSSPDAVGLMLERVQENITEPSMTFGRRFLT
jgi:hypothetical protein